MNSLETKSLFMRTHNCLFLKICGITNVKDAEFCIKAGVDAIGMLLARSNDSASDPNSDRISIDCAANISRVVSGRLSIFLLIHTSDFEEIIYLVDQIQPDALQLRDDLNSDYLRRFRKYKPGLKLIRSIAVEADTTLAISVEQLVAEHREALLDGVILDSPRRGRGFRLDWGALRSLITALGDLPVLLAGGLTPENVQKAVQLTVPSGVDVMSGVNTAKRSKKSHKKIAAFVHAARTPILGDRP